MKTKKSIVVAIDGNCASGKTTLGEKLSETFDARIIHTDDFYLPKGLKDLTTSNDGNMDLSRLNEEIISHLSDKFLIYRPFSCKEQKIISEKKLDKKELTIIEGSYSLNPFFGEYYDLSIFISLPLEKQIERLKIRNPNNYQDFVDKWIVLENRYFGYYQIQKKADIIIKNI